MQLSVDRLLEGMIHTLEQVVLPDVSSSYVRGQVFAVIDILNNLTGRLEVRSDLLEKDIQEVKEVLENVKRSLSAAEQLKQNESIRTLLSSIDEALNKESADVPLVEQRKALNALLDDIMVALDGCKEHMDEDKRLEAVESIRTHLRNWIFRELLALKPSMIRKMSKG